VFRRGTVLIRKKKSFAADEESKENERKIKDEFEVVEIHDDLVENEKFY
jgi:predicted DNA-binding protein with PD1-like motif